MIRSIVVTTSLAVLLLSPVAASAQDKVQQPKPSPQPGKTTGAATSLNPQPLPPKETTVRVEQGKATGAAKMLNPQPLPPKESPQVGQATGAEKRLNPQPLPPKETTRRVEQSRP